MVLSSFPCKLVVLAALLAACAKEAPKPVPIVEVKGDCAEVYKGQVCTWARMQDTTVIDVGATVPIVSVENAPKEPDMAWPPHWMAEATAGFLGLRHFHSAADLGRAVMEGVAMEQRQILDVLATLKVPEAARKQSGLTEFTVYWEATGHPPGPYMTPHFDFHFYTASPEERAAIDCKDNAKPEVLATGYSLPDQPLPPDMAKMIGVSTLVGVCVPQMGMHSLPTAELESKELFRGNMVIGYYHGKNVFIEPMLTRDRLLEKKSFDLPIPTIPGQAGNYPRNWKADYDSLAQSYRFVFTGFAPGK